MNRNKNYSHSCIHSNTIIDSFKFIRSIFLLSNTRNTTTRIKKTLRPRFYIFEPSLFLCLILGKIIYLAKF